MSPLQGSVFDRERFAEGVEIAGEHVDSPGIDGTQPILALEEMQRRAALGSRFREHERSMRKVEGGEVLPPCQLRSWWTPVQAAGNHQVKDQPEITVEADSNALADAAQFPHYAAFHAGNGRPGGSQQKGAGDAHVFERPADNARLKRADIGGDIR